MPAFTSPADRRDDPATVRLAAELGLNRWEALGRLDCLYWWTARYAPSGDLAPFSDAEIAAACDWTGEPDQLVMALLEAGVLTADATIADWYDLFGRYARQREGVARRVARHRGNGAGNGARNGAGNGVSNGSSNGFTYADAPSPPDPRTPEAPPTGAAPSEPPGDTGISSPGRSSGPEPGARAREAQVHGVPKPTAASVRLARIVDLVREAGCEIFPSARDGAAVKTCGAPADRIAEAYVAAARGEWDPGGDGWLGGNLSVHLVISRLAGYRPRRGGDFLETRYGRLVPPVRDPVDDGAVAF